MTDTPLFDATLSDQLLKARRSAEAAQARWALAEREARERVETIQRQAQERIAAAERRLALAEREARVRHALATEDAEDRVRTALATNARPLPPLRIELPEDEEEEREAPPIPTMEELMRPMPGINRFLDSLLGPSDR